MWQNHSVSHVLHTRHELHIRYYRSSSHAIPQTRRRNFVTFHMLTEACCEQNYHLLLWRSCLLVLYFPENSWHSLMWQNHYISHELRMISHAIRPTRRRWRRRGVTTTLASVTLAESSVSSLFAWYFVILPLGGVIVFHHTRRCPAFYTDWFYTKIAQIS